MRILVCVKQVPATAHVTVDEKTGVLQREGVESKLNPYDLFALETALRLREEAGGTVTAITMGPPQAQAAIRETFWMGADEGYVLAGRRLAGADVLATSYALSQGIAAIGAFDVILCGKQTTDGDTAQVGPALAEHLGLPHAAWVSRLERAEGGLIAYQELQSAIHAVFLPFPCIVTVEQDIYTPRLPSLKRKRETAGREVTVMGLDAFADQDEAHYGLNGSPTQVERIFPPPSAPPAERYEGETAAEALVERLRALKFL